LATEKQWNFLAYPTEQFDQLYEQRHLGLEGDRTARLNEKNISPIN
jgi:hypothetical protein